jgi:hypothetical protein
MPRYVLSKSVAGSHSTVLFLMSSSNPRNRGGTLVEGIRIVTFNIAKDYTLVDVLLKTSKKDFDILFLQEPPWRTIRHAPSATDREGAPIVGSPRRPYWTCMV